MSRISRDELYMFMAHVFSQRSTCSRRSVGCILVNRRGHVLATGYNGVPSGLPHCNEGQPCPGVDAKCGESLDECYATHAEQNALLQCSDVHAIETAYCTSLPCIHCLKLLMNTSCQRIVYAEGYNNRAFSELWDGELVYLPLDSIVA